MAKKLTEEEFRKELEGHGEAKAQEMLEAGTWAGPADKKLQIARQYVQELEEGQTSTTEANIGATGAKETRNKFGTFWVQLVIGIASVALTIAVWEWLKPVLK